jgi:glycosyltransferase involved in cell wall biosynthesis
MTDDRPRVLIVYHHLPHYRSGVFAELERSRDVAYEFAAGTVSRDGTIPTIPPTSLRRFFRLTNHWFGPFLWQTGLLSVLWRERHHAVVFFGDMKYLSTWVGALLCRWRGQSVLFWAIGWHRPDAGLRKRVRLAFYRLGHKLLLYGHTGARIGTELGYPADRIAIVGNSHISSITATGTRDEIGIEDLDLLLPGVDVDVVTAVVRLTKPKRLDLVVAAAAHLGKTGRKVVVVLVGTGPERENLRRLADALGVDLRLTGPIYKEEKLRLIYERTSVSVVPVNAGLTAVQSLSHGRPMITSDDEYHRAPESECIRPGQTGGFYVDGSAVSLAEVIAEWLDRVRAEPETVAGACRHEVETRWTSSAHAAAINTAVTAVLTRPERVS